MKHFVLTAASLLLTTAALAVVPALPPAGAQPPPVARQGLVVEPHGGRDIYVHTTNTDYRTSPALVTGSANIVNQYNCGPNPHGTGDVIRRSTSYDGGVNWSAERVVLEPNPFPSSDDSGVCDPSIVKVGSYYYLAYTGAPSNPGASLKNVFLARSTSLGGPFTKWNGIDWSGTGGNGRSPMPLTTGTLEASGPSLVVKDGTVSLYYNSRITTGPAAGTYQTRLATAPLGTGTQQPAWPTRLTPQPAVAIDHPRQYLGLDCVDNHWNADTDVKYDDTTGKWLALTSDQTYPWSALQAYESTDGRTFTKAIITRGDYQRGARTPGQYADNTGHLTPDSIAIAYAHSSGCGWADLRMSGTTRRDLTTGAIDQPLTTSAPGWVPQSGSWAISPSGYYQQTDSTFERDAASTLTGHALGGSSTITVSLKGGYHPSNGWIGVKFNQTHPGETTNQSGYTAYVQPPVPGNSGVRLCLVKAGFGLACRIVPLVDYNSWMRMTIAQTDGAIKVYLNGNSSAGIASTDADDPYLGGYLGLVTNGSVGQFRNLSAGDNVPGTSTANDWRAHGGDWTLGEGTHLANSLEDGQVNLRTDQNLTKDSPSQLGDGTYAATIRLVGSPAALAWGGIALADDGVTGSWVTGGYLVFLRANGRLGIHKAGVGQVVADIPTGTNPTSAAVRVRVLKTGANLQVYVNGAAEPVVNWTDANSPGWGIGGFGVANLDAPATFTDVTYDADQAR